MRAKIDPSASHVLVSMMLEVRGRQQTTQTRDKRAPQGVPVGADAELLTLTIAAGKEVDQAKGTRSGA